MSIQVLMHLLGNLPYFWIASALLGTWLVYWQVQGWLLAHRSGHYAPMITVLPRLLRWLFGTLTANICVGPVRVIGWEKLQNFAGRLIVTPKHVMETDAALVGKLARSKKVRFLIAINQTAGLRGAPLAWMGAISVGYNKHDPALSAANATKSAVETMTREKDSILLVFPEGKLDKKNILERANFRAGALRIGKACHQKAPEQNWHILPVDVRYETDPAMATPFQLFLKRLRIPRSFLGNTVYGATVVFGDPISVGALPESEDLSVDQLFDAIVSLRARKALPCGLKEY